MTNNEIIKFYPQKLSDGQYKECGVCGLCSFAHLHKPGTLPKDFERIEDPNYTKKSYDSKDCHCKEDWYEPEKCRNGICGSSHCEKCDKNSRKYSKSGNPENSQEKGGKKCVECHGEGLMPLEMGGIRKCICVPLTPRPESEGVGGWLQDFRDEFVYNNNGKKYLFNDSDSVKQLENFIAKLLCAQERKVADEGVEDWEKEFYCDRCEDFSLEYTPRCSNCANMFKITKTLLQAQAKQIQNQFYTKGYKDRVKLENDVVIPRIEKEIRQEERKRCAAIVKKVHCESCDGAGCDERLPQLTIQQAHTAISYPPSL